MKKLFLVLMMLLALAGCGRQEPAEPEPVPPPVSAPEPTPVPDPVIPEPVIPEPEPTPPVHPEHPAAPAERTVYSKGAGLMADNGHCLYLATEAGLYRYNYDGTGEALVFEGRAEKVAAQGEGYLFSGSTAADPELYLYQSDRCDGVPVPDKSADPFDFPVREETAAQQEAALYSDRWCVYDPGYDRPHHYLEVSGPEGQDRKRAAEFVLEGYVDQSAKVRALALKGDKLLCVTSGRTEYNAASTRDHHYILDLITGDNVPCPALDALVNAEYGAGRTLVFLGVTESAILFRASPERPLGPGETGLAGGCILAPFGW